MAAQWKLAAAALALSSFIVVRACGFDLDMVLAYIAYLIFYVAGPGIVALYYVKRGPVSLTQALALGLPTGFALEIFTFLGFSALGLKEAYAWSPLGWCALGLWIRCRHREWPLRIALSAHHAGITLGLAVAVLATAVMAASQMFAESPLADGLPTRAIFHDWVYLVSRAAVIKNHWPLEDPSLAGTPLQYHYFMMVHAAAVSWTKGIELTAVMLRLLYVPLGAILAMQAFVLGRRVTRSPWGGVIAAFLTVAASEMSFAPSYGEPMFLGLFVRWLFVSPTFFFGLIFCGALLLGINDCSRLQRCGAVQHVWLLLLGMAATGAKGTVVPVLVGALGLWAAWQWARERRVPVRTIGFAIGLTAAFLVVYIPTMLAWRTGDAGLRPFHAFQLAGFWKEHIKPWQEWFATWLPTPWTGPVAGGVCALVVFAGTCGVRLLAIPYLLWSDREKRDVRLVSWVGAAFGASATMGVLLELNSHGELYVLLMMRLPMAVLTAGFLMATWRRCVSGAIPAAGAARDAKVFVGAARVRILPRARRMLGAGVVMVAMIALGVQTSLWWARNRTGLREFLRTPVDLKPDTYMQELQEALLWVRKNTERNAVLVANSCTPENMQKDHWGALDHTLTGVHFYYSAISERRLWFEGPNYILDTTRARHRASLAADFFYRGETLYAETVSKDPAYVLLDGSLADGAKVTLPPDHRVFANRRIKIYRLPSATESGSPVAGAIIAAGPRD